MKGTIALAVVFLAYPFVFSNAFYLDIGVALLLAAISASAWNIVGGYAGQVSVGHCMFFGGGAIPPALVFLLYPFVFSNAFYLDIGVALLLAAISASAWNIVGGYAGQVSVGHCMFFGVGAYLPLLVYHHWQLPPIVGVPVGIAVSLVLAIVVGMPTFRLQGHYFSMATIAVAELIRLVVGTWDFVGAAIGLQGPAVGRGWYDLTFRSEVPYYYIFLVTLGVLLFITWAIERTRFGYYLRAIKAGARAGGSLGGAGRRTTLSAADAT